jgi:hypothetical protein
LLSASVPQQLQSAAGASNRRTMIENIAVTADAVFIETGNGCLDSEI